MRFRIADLKNKLYFWKHTKYESLLGFKENDSSIYDTAFLHSSMGRKDKKGRVLNNERLEYLGDAVLETVMSEMLFKQFPEQNEGFLSSSRSIMVCRKTTNEIGKELGFDNYIKTRRTINNANIYGNAFEALIGAIYIDKGYDDARRFVRRIYNSHVKFEKLMRKDKNYKSMLLEWSQKNRVTHSYELIEETRLENNKIRFQSKVIINGKPMGLGVGYSKRDSEQAAAKQALQTLK